jgi:hypothetical protein
MLALNWHSQPGISIVLTSLPPYDFACSRTK